MKNLCCTFFLLFCAYSSFAKQHPAENARVNYTLCKFTAPVPAKATDISFVIAKGSYKQEKEFQKNVLIRKGGKGNSALVQLPEFGIDYTWQVHYKAGGKAGKTTLYHFATDTSRFVDPAQHRLRVLTGPYPDSNMLFFLDYYRCLFNHKGEPVWFLPDIDSVVRPNAVVRDLKLTEDGTVTFLTNVGAYEIDMDANILWRIKKPGGARANRGTGNRFYHHEFTKLNNNTYLLLGTQFVKKKLPYLDEKLLENEFGVEKEGNEWYKTVEYGTVVLCDSNSNVKWVWPSSTYFTDADIFSKKVASGMFNTVTHMNGCHFDLEKGIFYAGFREVNRIVKVSYPDMKILGEYGDGVNSIGNGTFAKQHSYDINSEGNLYIFNNNVEDPAAELPSKIMVLREPENAKDSLEVLWEFSCDIDKEASPSGLRGGNVKELRDGSYICCMGTCPRVFAVNKRKEVLLNAIAEKWNPIDKKWEEYPQYRVNYVYQDELFRNLN